MELIRELTAEYNEYLRDESRTIGYASKIAFPKTEEELILVVKDCYEKGVQINIQGARTGLAGGASPLGGLVLNLSRMNKILGMRYDEKNGKYYMQVQPGVLLTQVRKALLNKDFNIDGWSQDSLAVLAKIKAGQLFFSPDPTETTASIGGMAACNASGARSFLYGATRIHINGLRVVLADGSVTDLSRGCQRADGRIFSLPLEGGGALKSNMPDFETPHTKDAGFYFRDDMDILDLFMGSQGTLGIISQLELSLMDAPKLMWGATAFFPSDEAAIKYVRLVRGEDISGLPVFQHRPASIEFFNKSALQMIMRQKELTPAFRQLQELPLNYHTGVYVEFNDSDPENFWPVLEDLAEIIEFAGGDTENTWVANCERELEKLLFFRHSIPETVDIIIDENKKNDPSITILSTDMSVPDDCIEKLFQIYKTDLAKTDLEWIIFGHVGENHFHPNILARNKAEMELGHKIFEKWAKDVTLMGGSISAEHGAGKIKRELAKIMYGQENMQKLKEFKRMLDPKSILGPGNIIS